MKKEAYFKMMNLDKKAGRGNVIGPAAGILLGGWRGHVASKYHGKGNPSKLIKALYILAGATGGGLIGNSIENAVKGQFNLPFVDRTASRGEALRANKEYLNNASTEDASNYAKQVVGDIVNRAQRDLTAEVLKNSK